MKPTGVFSPQFGSSNKRFKISKLLTAALLFNPTPITVNESLLSSDRSSSATANSRLSPFSQSRRSPTSRAFFAELESLTMPSPISDLSQLNSRLPFTVLESISNLPSVNHNTIWQSDSLAACFKTSTTPPASTRAPT